MTSSLRRIFLLLCGVSFLSTTVAGQNPVTPKTPVTNRTAPPLVKLASARGKLGRRHRESIVAPSFALVDLSKYRSGQLFAELKVSAGGCSAAMVATLAPTEDRRQMTEFTRAGSGGTKTTDLLWLTRGQVFLRGQHVNKFYISGVLIPIGIMAWYSRDCDGSYDITVYMRNATTGPTVEPPKVEQPCGDQDVQLTYDKESPSYHYYRTLTPVCSTNSPNCTVANVFSTMVSNVQFVVPETTSTSKVTNCMTFDADIPGLFDEDPIRIVVNPDGHSVTNYTRKDHVFHPGKVTRTIVQKGSSIFVETIGEGIGDYRLPNQYLAPGYWRAVDRLLVKAVNPGPR